MSKQKRAFSSSSAASAKHVIANASSYNCGKPIWRFDKLDRNGEFKFDLNRSDFNSQEVLEKLIAYGNMTWQEIARQTHDKKNRSKHHYLDYDGLSQEAKQRIIALKMDEDTDAIFSFALRNTVRIIGTRDGDEFHIIWYDPNHKFYPSSK